MNEFEIVRRIDGCTVRILAAYNELTDDWNMIAFVDGQTAPVDARATTDIWAEAPDMIEIALKTRI